MSISMQLNQKKLQEILFDIVLKGNKSKSLDVVDLVEDIKKQLVSSAISTN